MTSPADRVMGLERCMDYRGGPSALLYNGDMVSYDFMCFEAIPC